jgi:hypothetical protein
MESTLQLIIEPLNKDSAGQEKIDSNISTVIRAQRG